MPTGAINIHGQQNAVRPPPVFATRTPLPENPRPLSVLFVFRNTKLVLGGEFRPPFHFLLVCAVFLLRRPYSLLPLPLCKHLYRPAFSSTAFKSCFPSSPFSPLKCPASPKAHTPLPTAPKSRINEISVIFRKFFVIFTNTHCKVQCLYKKKHFMHVNIITISPL